MGLVHARQMVRAWDTARSATRAALDLVLPPVCAGCGTEGRVLCATCRAAVEARRSEPAGVPLGLPADVPSPLLQLEWCARFAGPVRSALHALKYGGERRLAGPRGEALAGRWRHAGAGGDVLVNVPVHDLRRQERGYDQAELLARAAGSALGLAVAPLLARRRATVAQFDLGRGERRANVAGAFVVIPGASPVVRERWVVLVDDVITTGATMSACAEALLDAGAIGVSAIAVARER